MLEKNFKPIGAHKPKPTKSSGPNPAATAAKLKPKLAPEPNWLGADLLCDRDIATSYDPDYDLYRIVQSGCWLFVRQGRDVTSSTATLTRFNSEALAQKNFYDAVSTHIDYDSFTVDYSDSAYLTDLPESDDIESLYLARLTTSATAGFSVHAYDWICFRNLARSAIRSDYSASILAEVKARPHLIDPFRDIVIAQVTHPNEVIAANLDAVYLGPVRDLPRDILEILLVLMGDHPHDHDIPRLIKTAKSLSRAITPV